MRKSTPIHETKRVPTFGVVLVLATLALGAANAFYLWQNNSLVSLNSNLQSSEDRLRNNASALDSRFSILDLQRGQLLLNRTSLLSKVADLNASFVNSSRVLETLHSLSNRTTIVSKVVQVEACVNCAYSPTPTVSVVNFTAKYPGYVIVTIANGPTVGEMYLSVWSDTAMCSENEALCEASAFPNFLGPGDSFLIPVLAGPVHVALGNFNNYPVSASVTVVLYD